MPNNRDVFVNWSEYHEKSKLKIWETLKEINTGTFAELRSACEVIAEFAATLNVKKWADIKKWPAKDRWDVRNRWEILDDEVFLINEVSMWDMKLIAAAQKAGAMFTKIELKETKARVVFNDSFVFQLELPSFKFFSSDENYDALTLVEALKSGLELKVLEIKSQSSKCYASVRTFFKELTSRVRINKMKVSGAGHSTLRIEDLELILSKLGTVLQSVDFLELSGLRITNNHVALIAKSLRVGIRLKGLNVSDNWITNDGARKLVEAIRDGVGIKYLDLKDNYITDYAALTVPEVTECSIIY